MNYLEQFHKIFTTALEIEKEVALSDANPTARQIIKAKSVLRQTKKEIDVLIAALEVKKVELIKSGAVLKKSAEDIEKEFLN